MTLNDTAKSGNDLNAAPVDSLLDASEWASLSDEGGLSRRIADQLSDAIIEGRLASGTRLSEVEIAQSFGISRTPVREALYMLQSDELVERPPRKGARVADVTAKQALDVYVCRAYLYALSARICAPILDEDQLAELAQIVSGMELAVAADDVREYYRLNVDFHDYIGRASGNGMLLKLMRGMGRLTLRFRYMSLTIEGRLDVSLRAHQQLLEDLRKHDAVAADRRVREIVSGAGDAVLAHFFDDNSNPVSAVTMKW